MANLSVSSHRPEKPSSSSRMVDDIDDYGGAKRHQTPYQIFRSNTSPTLMTTTTTTATTESGCSGRYSTNDDDDYYEKEEEEEEEDSVIESDVEGDVAREEEEDDDDDDRDRVWRRDGGKENATPPHEYDDDDENDIRIRRVNLGPELPRRRRSALTELDRGWNGHRVTGGSAETHLIDVYIFYSPLKNMVGYKFSLSSPPR